MYAIHKGEVGKVGSNSVSLRLVSDFEALPDKRWVNINWLICCFAPAVVKLYCDSFFMSVVVKTTHPFDLLFVSIGVHCCGRVSMGGPRRSGFLTSRAILFSVDGFKSSFIPCHVAKVIIFAAAVEIISRNYA